MRVKTQLLVGVLAVAGLAIAQAALAANVNQVSRGAVSPSGAGSPARPLPIAVDFALRTRAEDRALRPLPTKTYILGMEGVTAYPRAFPSCPLRQLKRRKGPPRRCRHAELGAGLVKGAAGLAEDETMAESVPCNLKLRLYNVGAGMALRLDGDPPLPPGFRSSKVGCPVPIHTAIPAPFRRVRIDGLPSTELRFTVPKLLMRPLEGWNSALALVTIDLPKRTARARVRGVRRTVGYFSATGCSGGERSLQVGFVGTDGARSQTSATPAC